MLARPAGQACTHAPTFMNRFYAHGKLLLTAEYFVLDGALALAVPTRQGQWLHVESTPEADRLLWQSYDNQGLLWWEGEWSWKDGQWINRQADDAIGQRLSALFAAALQQQPDCQQKLAGARVSSRLEFPRNWGLGSSSTLISNLAHWLEVDPWSLLAASFGGSGYDLACAQTSSPILYQLRQGRPHFVDIPWTPSYKSSISFVYTGQKQNSREGIQRYRARAGKLDIPLQALNDLTLALVRAADSTTAAQLLNAHEQLVGETIGIEPIQSRLYSDFPGQLKSLGAWGGDFMLAISEGGEDATRQYFLDKGLNTILPYSDMVLPT